MNRLRDLREDKNLRQEDIAKIVNTTQTNYSKYELEKVEIPKKVLIQLAYLYNTSIDYLLGITNEIKPYPRTKKLQL